MTSSERLSKDVARLASDIGERNLFKPRALDAAAEFLEGSFKGAGYAARRQTFSVEGRACSNLEAEIRGSDEIVVIGAHYDSVSGSPGANDNASGAAAVLELARLFAGKTTGRTLRFVQFVNEEPPHFQTPSMGSLVYAQACRERGEKITAMMSVETIGYYSDERGSQKYPFPFNLFYPSRGNFIGVVGNRASRRIVKAVARSFRRLGKIPCESVATFESIPGIGWSDQWAFWRHGYPGIMVTDTAPFRYPHYHTAQDTPDKVDFVRMARVVEGLEGAISDLLT